MAHQLLILDRSGHRTLEWSPALEASVAQARDVFNQLKADGHLAYTLNGEQAGVVLKAFDPTAETIILTPQMVGG